MKYDVFSLIPQVFSGYLGCSILNKAIENGLISVTDEPPYGGGGGMVMKPDPVFAAVESVVGTPPECPVILLTPQGRIFTQQDAQKFAEYPRLALICGRYEGFDERIREHLVTDEISIGDYVLTGGELPALILIDAISRNLNGVLGDPDGAFDDSHASYLLEYPHYTRPPVFRGWEVPEVLLSGNHAKINEWRRQQSLLRTAWRRPDLLQKAELSPKDIRFLRDQGIGPEPD